MLSLLLFHLRAHHSAKGLGLTSADNALNSDVDLTPEHASKSVIFDCQAHTVKVSKDGLVEDFRSVILVVSCKELFV